MSKIEIRADFSSSALPFVPPPEVLLEGVRQYRTTRRQYRTSTGGKKLVVSRHHIYFADIFAKGHQ